MRVVLLTPYSPLERYDHAADDVALPFVKALGKLVDLHVYAPGQRNGELPSWRVGNVTYHAGRSVHARRIARFDPYPYSARQTWSRQSTAESISLVRKLRPDVVHAEYYQPAEALLRISQLAPTSITLHDVHGKLKVVWSESASPIHFLLDQVERVKIERTTKAMLEAFDAIFVYSETDRRTISSARGHIEVTPGGLTLPDTVWLGTGAHVAAFGGAMWRAENEAAAVYLGREVMPLVRRVLPEAELRIFGSRPTAKVVKLGTEPGVTVVGEVEDFDDEFAHAGLTVAPSMALAGRLTKALRAMAMGCPVVLNAASARSIVGFSNREHGLVGDSPAEFAACIVELMRDGASACRFGDSARELIRANYSWESTAAAYLNVFAKIIAVSPTG